MSEDALRNPTKSELTHEIASISRSIDLLLFYGGGLQILENADPTLRTRGRGRGLAIYDEVARDPHVRSVMDKRKRASTRSMSRSRARSGRCSRTFASIS